MPRPQLLTPAAVRFLRKRYAFRKQPGNGKRGVSTQALCERWGITRTALWQAATGLTYKRVKP